MTRSSKLFVGGGIQAEEATVGATESGDLGHLVVGQIEAEQVEVLILPLRRGRLRDRHDAELQVPAQDHLSARHSVPLADRTEQGVRQQIPGSADRAPRLRHDAPVGVVGTLLGLGKERMQFDLVDRG